MIPFRKVPFVSTTDLPLNSSPIPVHPSNCCMIFQQLIHFKHILPEIHVWGFFSTFYAIPWANNIRSFWSTGTPHGRTFWPVQHPELNHRFVWNNTRNNHPTHLSPDNLTFSYSPIARFARHLWAIVCIFMVINKTFDPIFAAAAAASQPAWLAPTTITSYCVCMINSGQR